MKIRALIVCLCISGCLSSQASATAITKNSIIQLSWEANHGGADGGGAFTIWQSGEKLGLTFCLEHNEYINLNTDLLVGAVSDRAVLGGLGGQVLGGPDINGYKNDPLSKQTAYLYQSFATNSLGVLGNSGYTFAYNNSAWNNAMQKAIWYLEGEISGTPTSGSNTAALVAFANSYTDQDVSGVSVLNLFLPNAPAAAIAAFNPQDNTTWSADLINNYRRQDQLYYQPHAPEPTSGALWLSAMCLLAGRARVRAKLAIKH